MFDKEIAWLSATGITLGCDDAGTLFCPQSGVRRGQMASFLVRALDLPPGPDAFGDDNGTTHEDAINALAATGITEGCTSSTFCPDEEVTRGQMASFLARALDLPPGPDAFGDDNGTTHEDAINALAATGITQGCTSSTFCPLQVEVTRGQMAAFSSTGRCGVASVGARLLGEGGVGGASSGPHAPLRSLCRLPPPHREGMRNTRVRTESSVALLRYPEPGPARYLRLIQRRTCLRLPRYWPVPLALEHVPNPWVRRPARLPVHVLSISARSTERGSGCHRSIRSSCLASDEQSPHRRWWWSRCRHHR